MKNFKRIVCLILTAITLTVSLTGCTNKLEITPDGLTHKKTGISYTYVLDPCYQPVEFTEEAYTKWKYNDMTVEYHQIKGLSPEEWLYCPITGDILNSTDTELPDLIGFEPTSAAICIESTTAYSIYDIDDPDLLAKIVEEYMSEDAKTYSVVGQSSNYSLKFISKKYPAFYYSVVLVADADGVYIHDRMSGRYVDMGRLFDEYNLYEGFYESED